MCDKEHFEKLEDRVGCLEKAHAIHEASAMEKFQATEKTMGLLVTCFKWVFGSMFLLLLIMAFTVVYGAIGERGLHSVSNAVNETTH